MGAGKMWDKWMGSWQKQDVKVKGIHTWRDRNRYWHGGDEVERGFTADGHLRARER